MQQNNSSRLKNYLGVVQQLEQQKHQHQVQKGHMQLEQNYGQDGGKQPI